MDEDMIMLKELTSGDIHIANRAINRDLKRLRERINNPLIDMYRVIVRYSDNLTLLIIISLMTDETIERVHRDMIRVAKTSNIQYRKETLELFLRERKGKE